MLASFDGNQDSYHVSLQYFRNQASKAFHHRDADSFVNVARMTIKHLEQLSAFATVDELPSYARDQDVQPVEPKVLLEGEVARVLLPGEPGY